MHRGFTLQQVQHRNAEDGPQVQGEREDHPESQRAHQPQRRPLPTGKTASGKFEGGPEAAGRAEEGEGEAGPAAASTEQQTPPADPRKRKVEAGKRQAVQQPGEDTRSAAEEGSRHRGRHQADQALHGQEGRQGEHMSQPLRN